MEEKVLIQIDELRLAVKNCYMRSRLSRLDVALADGDCNAALLELGMLYDYAVALMLKLQECQCSVSDVKFCGGFSYGHDVKSHERSAVAA